jgi:UrcA family protein
MTILKTGAAAAFLAIAFAAAPASANPVGFSYRVNETELANVQGAESVYRDLLAAANSTCRREAPSAMRTVNTDCRDDLVNAAVAQINNANLRTVAEREQGRVIELAAR